MGSTEKLKEILTELEQLTIRQRSLIAPDGAAALEQNIARKDELIGMLQTMSPLPSDAETEALLRGIAEGGKENIQAVRDEMERLRGLMKKTHEGMTTVRGYDPISSGLGATYIDKKQ
jgi:hypothetical protein